MTKAHRHKVRKYSHTPIRRYALTFLLAFFILNSAFSFDGVSSPLPIQWFYTEGCYKCAAVKQLLDKIERAHAGQLTVERLDITELENYKRMMALELQYGVKKSSPMEIFVGDQYLLGHDNILRGLEKTVVSALSRSISPSSPDVGLALARSRSVSVSDVGRAPRPAVVSERSGIAAPPYSLPAASPLAESDPKTGTRLALPLRGQMTESLPLSYSSPAIENPWPTSSVGSGRRQSKIENLLLARLRPLAVASAGLVDGVNPCAFATVVFLVALLLGRNFTPSQILRAGLSFSAAVFASYFLIGLGAFRLVYRLNAFPLVSAIVFWGIAAGVIGLGMLSVKDAFAYRRTGQAAAVALAMPGRIRTRLHSALRAAIRPVHIVAACFAAGMAVSALELVCTGQIYLPTIMMLAGAPSTRWPAFVYLALYNVMFILPLLVVLGLCLAGIRLGAFVQWSQKSVVAVKLAMAVLFFGLGAALIAPRIME